MLNIDESKSYATEANLLKALAKVGLSNTKFMVVRNRAGRYTAIFGYSWNPDLGTMPAHLGFPIVG